MNFRPLLLLFFSWSSVLLADTKNVQLKISKYISSASMSELLQIMSESGWKFLKLDEDPHNEIVLLDFACFDCITNDIPPGLALKAARNDALPDIL